MPDLSSDKPIIAEAVRATEAGAIAAARLMGRGDRDGADQTAVTAMRKAMDDADISGTIVIGEGERDDTATSIPRINGAAQVL
jgi:fructose-1,6-bisphosphatase/sedoheptulose 1,7-bisphosphatase-like protein